MKNSGFAIFLICVFLFVGILFSMSKIVDVGDIAVEKLFGEPRQILRNGFNIVNPLSAIQDFSIKVRHESIRTDVATADRMNLEVEFYLEYSLDEAKLILALSKYEVTDASLKAMVSNNFKQSAKDVYGSISSDIITIDRQEISSKILVNLKPKLEAYPIQLNKIIITEYVFDEDLRKAIIGKQVAKEKLQRSETDIKRELLLAKKESKVFGEISPNISRDILYWKFLEKWDGKIPALLGSQVFSDINTANENAIK